MRVLIEGDDIRDRIGALAKDIAKECDIANARVLLVGIMTGSLPFFYNLIEKLRETELEFDYDTIKVKSYEGTKRKKAVIYGEIPRDYDIYVVVDGIVDSGKTMQSVIVDVIKKRIYNNIKIISVAMIVKKRNKSLVNHYLYEIEDDADFLVGFGMGDNNKFRELDDVYTISRKDKIVGHY